MSSLPKGPSKSRATLACQRCKGRKQKCDGHQPACSNCRRSRSECCYVASRPVRKAEQRLYIKALEERVAELESRFQDDGLQGVAEDHWEKSSSTEQVSDSLSAVVRDLALHSSGLYIGGASNLALGRMLGSIVHNRNSARAVFSEEEDPSVANHSLTVVEPSNVQAASPAAMIPSSESELRRLPKTTSFANHEVNQYFSSYMEHVSIQYPLIHSIRLIDWHNNRMTLAAPFETCVMHLTYAIGGLMLKFSGQGTSVNADAHYEAAMEYRDLIIQYSDRRSIIFLAMAAFYCFRAPKNPGPWMMIGLAMRLCIALGLHRKSSACRSGLSAELDKRLFWTCYLFDREITIGTGRPPTISDRDIDTEFPLEMPESSTRLEDFFSAANHDPNTPTNPPTTLTFFLHLLRIKRIGSEIQHEIYRVDKDTPPCCDIINSYLKRLDGWLAISPSTPEALPSSLQGLNNGRKPSYARLHLKGSYLLQYHSAKRFLLFPLISQAVVDPEYLAICADACAGVCEAYKKLHDYSSSICYTPQATQRLFLAGLTLIYCIWRSPHDLLISNHREAVTNCSIMLYVLTERWSPALKYRKVFERVKSTVFDFIVKEKCNAKGAIEGIIDEETRTVLDSLGNDSTGAGMDTLMDFTRIINEFAGDTASTEGADDSGGLYGPRPYTTFNSGADMTGIEWDWNWNVFPSTHSFRPWEQPVVGEPDVLFLGEDWP